MIIRKPRPKAEDKIIAAFRAKRLQQNLTYKNVAKVVRINITTLHRIEMGQKPKVSDYKKIMSWLDKDLYRRVRRAENLIFKKYLKENYDSRN